MNTATPLTDLREGLNESSAVERVLVLGWYDGPTQGLLQLANSGSVYRFDLLDEQQRADEIDARVFGLYPLPADSLDRIAEAVARHEPVRWPVWCPRWQFPSEEVTAGLDTLVDSINRQAGPLTWVVVGSIGAGPLRAMPVRAARAS